MKKAIILLIVFLGVKLITLAGNHDVNNLHAMPGMPVIHKVNDNQSANNSKLATENDMGNVFAHYDTEGYVVNQANSRDNGKRFSLLPGNTNASHWQQKKVVSKGNRTAEAENIDKSPTQNQCKGAVMIDVKFINCLDGQKMLVAHKTPKAIFYLNKKCKARKYLISMGDCNDKNVHDLIRNMDVKITASCTEIDTWFYANALKKNPKPDCVIVIEATLSETEERKPENNTVSNTGLEFIMPQRI